MLDKEEPAGASILVDLVNLLAGSGEDFGFGGTLMDLQ